MRYAIFSDIHGNRQAWERVLADMREQGLERLVCLGDAVGYGPRPEEVLADIRGKTDLFVMGNHDAAAAGLFDAAQFNDHARKVIEWTRDQLSPESMEFLLGVPLTAEEDGLLFVHAEAEQPGRFDYVEDEATAARQFAATDARVIFVGHTHVPVLFDCGANGEVRELDDTSARLKENDRYLVNVGSVGDMRHDEDDRARYVIFDSDTREVLFRRVEWDRAAFAAEMDETVLKIDPGFRQRAFIRRA